MTNRITHLMVLMVVTAAATSTYAQPGNLRGYSYEVLASELDDGIYLSGDPDGPKYTLNNAGQVAFRYGDVFNPGNGNLGRAQAGSPFTPLIPNGLWNVNSFDMNDAGDVIFGIYDDAFIVPRMVLRTNAGAPGTFQTYAVGNASYNDPAIVEPEGVDAFRTIHFAGAGPLNQTMTFLAGEYASAGMGSESIARFYPFGGPTPAPPVMPGQAAVAMDHGVGIEVLNAGNLAQSYFTALGVAPDGQVAYLASSDYNPGSGTLFRSPADGSSFTYIGSDFGGMSYFGMAYGYLQINSSGNVAYLGLDRVGDDITPFDVNAIVLANGVTPRTVIASEDLSAIPESPSFSMLRNNPGLNELNQVIFQADYNDGLGNFGMGALFNGGDPLADLLIKPGDDIFDDGRVVTSIQWNGRGLNDLGQFALIVQLEDPINLTYDTVLLLATPQPAAPTPEPASLALIAIGSLTLLRRRARR